MRVQCDVCEKNVAVVMCCADEAALCNDCDRRVHAANKLANKHQRVAILQTVMERPTCDICQEKSAFFFCMEDRALLCRMCDTSIHLPNTLSASHRRFLLTNTRVALDALPAEVTASPDAPSSVPTHNTHMGLESLPGQDDFDAHLPTSAGFGLLSRSGLAGGGRLGGSMEKAGNVVSSSAAGDVLGAHTLAYARASVGGGGAGPSSRRSGLGLVDVESVPGWRVDELLNIPELADGYTLADVGSSKAETTNLGEFDWTADLSLFDEQIYAETLHEVPQLATSPGGGGGGGASGGGLRGAVSRAQNGVGAVAVGAPRGRSVRPDSGSSAVVPDFDDSFLVPDMGLSSSPPSKRRRGLL